MFSRARRLPRPASRAAAYMVSASLGAASLLGCGELRGALLSEADAGAPAGDASAASIVFRDVTSTPLYGGSTGTDSVDVCPDHQAVIGYRGFLVNAEVNPDPQPFVGGVETLCGVLAVDDAAPNSVTIAPGATLPVRGDARDAPWSEACGEGEVLVGFAGRSGTALDQLVLLCAPLRLSSSSRGAGAGDGGDSMTLGAPVASAPHGGDGGVAFQEACPTGQIARGTHVRSASWVDAFGLVCGTPALDAP